MLSILLESIVYRSMFWITHRLSVHLHFVHMSEFYELNYRWICVITWAYYDKCGVWCPMLVEQTVLANNSIPALAVWYMWHRLVGTICSANPFHLNLSKQFVNINWCPDHLLQFQLLPRFGEKVSQGLLVNFLWIVFTSKTTIYLIRREVRLWR